MFSSEYGPDRPCRVQVDNFQRPSWHVFRTDRALCRLFRLDPVEYIKAEFVKHYGVTKITIATVGVKGYGEVIRG